MDTPSSIIELAERFLTAIMAKDIPGVRAAYAPDARIWHNTDSVFQSVEDNIRGVHWIHKVLSNVHYEIKQRFVYADGFVQEHILRGTLASGESFAMPACVICTVQAGRITSLCEYLDSAHVQPLLKSRT